MSLFFSGCIHSEAESFEHTITSKNIEPVALISLVGTVEDLPKRLVNSSIDGFVYAGDTVVFNASDSYDPDGDIVSYEWFFYDGSSLQGSVVSYVFDIDDRFSFAGSTSQYSVVLEIKDCNGSLSFLEYIVGVLPKSFVYYFDSSVLVESVPGFIIVLLI